MSCVRTIGLLALCLLFQGSGCTRLNPDFDPFVPQGDLGRDASRDGQAPADLAGVDVGTQDLARDHDDLSSAPDLARAPDLRLPPVSCEDRFGMAPGFMSCAATSTSCRFYLKTAESASCTEVCAVLGQSQCLSAWDIDSVSCSVGGLAQVPCSEQHRDKVCECSNG